MDSKKTIKIELIESLGDCSSLLSDRKRKDIELQLSPLRDAIKELDSEKLLDISDRLPKTEDEKKDVEASITLVISILMTIPLFIFFFIITYITNPLGDALIISSGLTVFGFFVSLGFGNSYAKELMNISSEIEKNANKNKAAP